MRSACALARCRGRYHAVNVPLKDGMTDEAYEQVFQPVMRRVVEVYQPEVIVFQSGAPPWVASWLHHCGERGRFAEF